MYFLNRNVPVVPEAHFTQRVFLYVSVSYLFPLVAVTFGVVRVTFVFVKVFIVFFVVLVTVVVVRQPGASRIGTGVFGFPWQNRSFHNESHGGEGWEVNPL